MSAFNILESSALPAINFFYMYVPGELLSLLVCDPYLLSFVWASKEVFGDREQTFAENVYDFASGIGSFFFLQSWIFKRLQSTC